VEPAARLWLRATAAAAVTITVVDIILLQQKKAFFTGGFLAATYAAGWGEAIGFVLATLAVDASLAGVIAAAVLLPSARLRLAPRARLFLVSAGALAPLVVWDFVNYSLLTHLGDAFDIGLMFDLTGRHPSELLAVSSSHALFPAALMLVAGLMLIAIVWAINRSSDQAGRRRAGGARPMLVTASALFAAGLVVFVAGSGGSDVMEDGLRRKASGQFYTLLASRLTDFDRDGYGLVGRTADPDAFNGSVYPYAVDVPGNGLDEDGVGGDLPAGTTPLVEADAPASPWRHRPDVVLFVLESFRADTVGRTVNGRPVTPVMDALAREGVASAQAFSHNGYTTQSRFHLLTGTLAGLPGHASLIDDFKAQGYETAYFSAQDESFGGPALGVGFERADVRYDARQDRDRRYSTFTTAGSLAVPNAVVRQRIEEFLRGRQTDRPLFLYVNFHDTHFPYHHEGIDPLVSDGVIDQAQIVPENASQLREMYDNTAANVDRAIGLTLDMVTRANGRAPAVVVTADHGESLFDEGFLGHGYALNDAQTRIPLIARGIPLEIAEPFGQADLRGAIVAALSRDVDAGTPPRISRDPEKSVFQYLGNVPRPRQIGFMSGSGRLVYDFRDRRVVGEDGAQQMESLSGETAARLLRLVRYWERMMLARGSAGELREN
jgi:hypothetical protein